MASKQVVVFEVNGDEYGIDVSSVNGILRYKNFTIKKLPGIPPTIEGVINLRGNVNYIYNLRRIFQLTEKDIERESKIIMVYAGAQTVGYIVDEVTDIVHVPEENIENAPAFVTNIQGEYITGIGKIDDRLIVMLDTARIQS